MSRRSLSAPVGRRLYLTVLAGILVVGGLAVGPHTAIAASGESFLVDCVAGSDAWPGTTAQPWRSLTKASSALLAPGDVLMLERGCTWNGQRLDAAWNGTASAPIKITSHGSGALPVVKNGVNQNFKITGSYLIFEGLESVYDSLPTTTCGQPIGEVYGFNVTVGGHDNIIRNSVSRGSTAGVHLGAGSRATTVTGNVLSGNNALVRYGTSSDTGAWGVLVRSNDNEIASNTFSSNRAVCPSGGKFVSTSVKIDKASDNEVHHNQSTNDRVFVDLASSVDVKSSRNMIAVNLFNSNLSDSRFVVTRGAGDPQIGPVQYTRVVNNTVYQTGYRSQAVVCTLGCSTTVLELSSNVLWAEEKVVYADAPFALGRNLAWNSSGSPVLQVTAMSLANFTVADPRFVNPANVNFRLILGSPAIDQSEIAPLYPTDVTGAAVPQGPAPDFGAFEASPDTTTTTTTTTVGGSTTTTTAPPDTSKSFLVDCVAGSDAWPGTTAQPWRSLTKASSALLAPGDVLMLERGCTWNGQRLDAAWNGTASAPIKITSHGSGALPVVKNGVNQNFKITGSYLIFEGLESVYDSLPTTTCGQPIGEVYGFNVTVGGHDNIIRNSVSRGSTAGVHLGAGSRATTVTGNVLSGNNALVRYGTSSDTGAWGVLVRSNDNEIASNTFSSNRAVCPSGGKFVSTSVKIDKASDNEVHHNQSTNDRVFVDLASSVDVKSSRNMIAVNLFNSNLSDSRFVVTRGAGDPQIGPVQYTRVVNNTVYQTGYRSQAVVCTLGCSTTVLELSSNVLWAEEKVVYADAPFALGRNLAWNSSGSPVLQVTAMSLANFTVADPRFVNPANVNFRLILGSPAIDQSEIAPLYPTDVTGAAVPQGPAPDFGAFEASPDTTTTTTTTTVGGSTTTTTAPPDTSKSYYVNCSTGNDAWPGTMAQPWRSMAQASLAPLAPGDQLLLARGCTWDGQHLDAVWFGSATAPITISNYGTGPLPVVKNGQYQNFKITGNYLIFDGLESDNDPRNVIACGQSIGRYYGFNVTGSAHDNIIRNSVSRRSTAGIHLALGSRATTVTGNLLTGNNVLETFGTGAVPGDDLGAWGMLVHSNDNEIFGNTFEANTATCTWPAAWLMSNSIELYEASRNNIYQNRSLNDRVFSELGSGAVIKSVDNTFADNLFESNLPDSRFMVTRGAQDDAFGPVSGTKLFNNTTYQTGARSQAVVCMLGCSASVLIMTSNVLWAEDKILYSDGPFTLGRNVAWNSVGSPVFQASNTPLDPFVVADPQFVDRAGHDFRVAATSPAVDQGQIPRRYPTDIDGTPAPQGAGPDLGAYERPA